jgi:hypothetical protein
MKFAKMLTVVPAVLLALMGLASTASATTLEVNGVAQAKSVTLSASLKAGISTMLTDTFGSLPPLNTCGVSAIQMTTSVVTGSTVSGPVKIGPTFESCTEGNAVVDTLGTFTIERIAGTTNGTLRSIGTKVTWSSSIGPLTCITSSTTGTDLGLLTGVASGNATLDINAVLSCGPVDTKWQGTYTVTSPTGLGVTS